MPAGGVIAKDADGRLTGMVMETGYLQTYAKLPIPTEATELQAAKAGQAIYAAAGVTTVQEGATHANQLEQLQRLQAADALYLDIVAYPFMTDLGPILDKNAPSTFGTYGGHLKLGGCKILTDGSPQGKTAFFTTPYLTGGPNGEANWVGEPTAPQADINAVVKTCYDNNLPVLFHANGDAGIDMLIAAHEANAAGSLSADRRTTAIHAQFVRPDQIAKFAEYKIIPSAFTEHTFFFGDTHVLNRGMEQAAFMSPMKAYYEAGLRPANHTDYAVAPVDQMMTIWTAVNRVSRSGVVIGPEQRISPLDALKAITINGAYIYREEDSKGSIEVGKRADLVVLSDNPLTVDPMAVKDIKVLETIKDGKIRLQGAVGGPGAAVGCEAATACKSRIAEQWWRHCLRMLNDAPAQDARPTERIPRSAGGPCGERRVGAAGRADAWRQGHLRRRGLRVGLGQSGQVRRGHGRRRRPRRRCRSCSTPARVSSARRRPRSSLSR